MDDKNYYLLRQELRNKKQKTILISISRGVLVRNILRTSVLTRLLEHNCRVVVVVPVTMHNYFREEFDDDRIVLEQVTEKHYSKVRKFVAMLMNNLIYTETEHKKMKFGKAGGQPDPAVIFWIKHLAFSLLSRMKFLRRAGSRAEIFFFFLFTT